jgi:hypothetical protein
MVLRFKDKKLMKGLTNDFSPHKNFFHLKLLSGAVVIVNTEKLKAAFFVKTFNGNKDYIYKYNDFIPWGGNKIKIEFIDGEVIIGYTPHHPSGHRGFFVTPADLQGNNKRIFVIASSTKKMTIL